MAYTSVDDALNHLVRLQSTRGLTLSMKSRLQELKIELEFLRFFFRWMVECCLDYRNLENLLKEIEKVVRIAGRRLQSVRSNQIEDIAKDVNNLAPKVLKGIGTLKRKIEVQINDANASSSWPNAPVLDKLVIEFIDSLIKSLKDLISYQGHSSLPAGEELRALATKLRFSRSFLKFAAKRCTEHEKLKDLYTYAEAVALEAACLSFICSSDPTTVDIKDKLAELLRKINPSTQEIRGIHAGVFQALKPHSN